MIPVSHWARLYWGSGAATTKTTAPLYSQSMKSLN